MPPAPAGAGSRSADLSVALTVDGVAVDVEDHGGTLLDALRGPLGLVSVKDGCSPQGQCGCCTVLVDGRARVACVTPLRRVAGRDITTVDGISRPVLDRLTSAFLSHGASQCGFCTPGILCRLSALPAEADAAAVETALLAHLCRCTGWRSIVDAGMDALSSSSAGRGGSGGATIDGGSRENQGDRGDGPAGRGVSARASLEGGVTQRVGADVVAGRGGFSADTAPEGALVAIPDGRGDWLVGESLAEAQAAAGKVQGRRSGRDLTPVLALPPGEWALTLTTSWVEPGYLEPDAAWCSPGGQPTSPVANGGAFGGKSEAAVVTAARVLADRHGRPVLALLSREDVVRIGPKRPPVAAGLRLDGSGTIRVVRTTGIAEAIASVAPGVEVEEVDVPGPPTSARIRAAGWAEALVLLAGLGSLRPSEPGPDLAASGGVSAGRVGRVGRAALTAPGLPAGGPGSAGATVSVDATGRPIEVAVTVDAGRVLDEVVLRSYIGGATHMALGWVTSEGVAVDEDGVPVDLTIRSWGILRARDMPPVSVSFTRSEGPPVAVADTVFAAVAAATWIALGLPPRWPTSRGAFQ